MISCPYVTAGNNFNGLDLVRGQTRGVKGQGEVGEGGKEVVRKETTLEAQFLQGS